MKWERDNQVIPRADLNLMQISSDFGSDVSIDKAIRKLRMLSEDIQLSATSDRTNEGDGSVCNVINLQESEFWGVSCCCFGRAASQKSCSNMAVKLKQKWGSIQQTVMLTFNP
jgi:hypothetical protein